MAGTCHVECFARLSNSHTYIAWNCLFFLACASDSVVAGDCLLHNLWSPGCFYEARKGTARTHGSFPEAHRAGFPIFPVH
jgi:hypothetical protein